MVMTKKKCIVRKDVFYYKEKLQIEEKTKLETLASLTPASFAHYLKTAEAVWYWIVLTISILTVLATFLVLPNSFLLGYIRHILGIVFILWLPGYTFVKVVFPNYRSNETSEEKFHLIERIALSIGLSIALTPMIGLLLYYSSWGINLISIVLSLLVLTLFFATVAIIREYQKARMK
jgi:uncharacterized membrane protein